MSVHAMIAAAYLEGLPQTTKLVLMAIADSSDEHTLEAAPGLPKLRAWSGLSRSQTLNLVKQLTDAGYVERVRSGRAGRRAVYRVFPAGMPAIPHPSEVAARYPDDLSTPVDNPVDNPENEGPTDRTLGPAQGPISGNQGPTAMRPLQSFTSVSSGSTSDKPCGQRPATPSRPSSGFPGARTVIDEDAAGKARRARGANDRPCPVGDHGSKGEIHGGCGRCAHAAAESDPAVVAEARRRARLALNPRTSTTATEEKTA